MENFKKNSMKKIIGIGNALIDALVQVENDLIISELGLQKGAMQLIDRSRYFDIQERFRSLHPQYTTGGSACNTILALANMGAEPALIGTLGQDDLAQTFASNCEAHGIHAHIIHHDTLPTGVASTIITPDGQRTFGTYLGAAACLEADKLQPQWFEGYDYFYIEGYLVQNHDLIRTAIRMAHDAGMQVCLDLASYNIVEDDRDFFREILPQVDIVFANEQEARAFTCVDDAQHNVEQLAKLCSIAVVKIGKEGVLVRRGDEQVKCPARDVPHVVDTTAAGDYFSAGFLFALAADESLMRCAQLGSLLAGHIIEVVGTALSPSTWEDIMLEWGGDKERS